MGCIDVYRLAALQGSNPDHVDMVMGMLADSQKSMRFTVRPSRVMPEIETVIPDDGWDQVQELESMSSKVFARARIRIGFTFARRVC